MDVRAALIFLLTARAAVGAVNREKREALNESIRSIQTDIQNVLEHLEKSLVAPGLLPNTPCPSLNITQLVGPEGTPLNASSLCSIRCCLLKMSELTPELADTLMPIGQGAQDAVQLMGGVTVHQNCTLPHSKQDMRKYTFVKCLLQRLHQWLGKATF